MMPTKIYIPQQLHLDHTIIFMHDMEVIQEYMNYANRLIKSTAQLIKCTVACFISIQYCKQGLGNQLADYINTLEEQLFHSSARDNYRIPTLQTSNVGLHHQLHQFHFVKLSLQPANDKVSLLIIAAADVQLLYITFE